MVENSMYNIVMLPKFISDYIKREKFYHQKNTSYRTGKPFTRRSIIEFVNTKGASHAPKGEVFSKKSNVKIPQPLQMLKAPKRRTSSTPTVIIPRLPSIKKHSQIKM